LKRWSINDLVKAALFAALYLVVAHFGLQIHPVNTFATLVWPPTGIALAAILLLGFRFWPSIAVGAFLANLWAGASVPVAAGIAAGNTLEALISASLLLRISGFRPSLERLQDVLGLVGFAAIFSSAISATIGVSSLVLGGILPPGRFAATWDAWWLGDAIGALIVAPLILTWSLPRGRPIRWRRLAEFGALAVLVILMSVLLFEVAEQAPGGLLAPFLVWAAIRFEQRGASGAMFLLSTVAIWATVRGHGPYSGGLIEDDLFRLQAFMALNASTFLVLATVTSERRRAREEAESANRSKDRFLAALSHELRTPLMPVLALTSSLEEDQELPAETRRQLEIVRRNTELEARLIDDLLDLTRIAKGKLRVEMAPVVVSQVLDHVTEICRGDIASRGLTLERKETVEGAVILADAARLQQILWNLIQNAIKFTPYGGKIQVRTAASASAGRVAIEVSDTGAGIDPSQMRNIFEPFRQAGQRVGGLGLGLAISSGLVEALGGTLTAQSDGLGKGAIFRAEFDLLEEPLRPASRVKPSLSRAGSARPRRVLLVEDHADTLRATRELLSELSCDVYPAGSLSEAIAAADAQRFDLVVSDLGLPDGSGLELMRRLRDRHGLAGIALTGYGTENDIRQGREAGFVTHLVKPITFQTLARAIDSFFESRAAGART
jgi:signal transduction histidine kinase/ActR/RegA family two-component response regulator